MEGGKWGIVIVIAAFMIQFLAFGTTATIGVYNIEFLEYFGHGNTIGVSLIASLNYGIFLGSGPVVSYMMTKFSYRKIALLGSALIVLGLLGMPLFPYIPAMCFCYGVLTGFGSCCAYIPSHVLSGLYYDKNRSLATGIATSGSGLGGAVMPVVAGLLIDTYSWKGSLVFVAGLCLHLFVFSSLLRMPPTIAGTEVEIVVEDESLDVKDENNEVHDFKENVCGEEKMKDSVLEKEGSEKSSVKRSGDMNLKDKAKLLETENTKNMSGSSPVDLNGQAYIKLERTNKPHFVEMSSKKSGAVEPSEFGHKIVTSGMKPITNAHVKKHVPSSRASHKAYSFKSLTKLNGKSDDMTSNEQSRRSLSYTVFSSSSFGLDSDREHIFHRLSRERTPKTNLYPYSFSRSLSALHTMGTTRGSSYVVFDTWADDGKDDNMTVADEESQRVLEAETGRKGSTDSKVKSHKPPKSSRHFYIFTHYGFNVYFLSNIMWNAGCSIVSSFAPEYLRSEGLTSMEAAWMLGAFGFGCFLGGVLGGILGNAKHAPRQTIYTLANIIMGVFLVLFPLVGGREFYLVCLLLSGTAFGVILGLLIVVLTDLIGIESLSNGLGYLMLSNGIGTFIGPFLAGVIKETTGGFESGIILSGILCILGGLIMLLMPCRDLVTHICVTCCPMRRQHQVQVKENIALTTGAKSI